MKRAQDQTSRGGRPDLIATVVFVAGLVLTYTSLSGDLPSSVARHAAIGTGVSVGLLILAELRHGLQNLMRADLIALLALYFLIFFEFLFAQPMLDELVQYKQAIEPGISVCLWAFGVMSIGRHCMSGRVRPWRLVNVEPSPSVMVVLFWVSFAIGYFHMLLAVNFNPVAMVSYFFESRFEVPWGRGQFGDAQALLYELGATLYLVPPLAGIILGRRKLYSFLSVLLVLLGLLFTLFYGFSTGTRNVIGSYLITFLVTYFYASSASRWKVIFVSAIALAIIFVSTVYGLRFRNVGLRNYLNGIESGPEDTETTLFVDYNLYVVSKLVAIFPETVDYIGWDGPIWLLVRPIPRVLWPGKPEGQNVAAENVFAIEGTTISSTFIGESYMCAGLLGVTIAAMSLGMLARWWTLKAFSARSDFGILIYGSGFFAVVMTMRSIYILPVAILPTVAAALVGSWLARRPAQIRVPSLQAG